MKIFYRPAPFTIRLALSSLALLLVAWWAGTGWGEPINIITPGAKKTKYHMPDTIRSSHTEEIYQGGFDKGTVGGLEAVGTLWDHGGMPAYQPFAVMDTSGNWHIYRNATTDSLAARIEMLERKERFHGTMDDIYFWAFSISSFLALSSLLFLLFHQNKKWMEVHKP